MRTAISLSGVLAALLLAGACFDPTRACSTDADCVNGGTCDPGTKTCVAAGNPNDKNPPVFSIVVTGPSPRPDTAKLTGYDPGAPDGGHDAFRRDESVQVTVTSHDQDVSAGSVKLLAHGIAASAGTALDVPLAPCGSANPAASNPFCREGTVPLASLPFEAFRAVVPLEVSGTDLSNNVGTADAGLNVTRWKWRYSAGAPIYTTPAIADDGTIVFGTSDGGSGSVYALADTGTERWVLPLGPLLGSPSVGSMQSGAQIVYVATASRPSALHARYLADGSDAGSCPASTDTKPGGEILSTAAVFASVGLSGTYESATAFASQQGLVTIRPGAQSPDQVCLNLISNATQSPGQNLIATDSSLLFGTSDGAIRAFNFDSGNWTKNSGWSAGAGFSPIADGSIGPLALTDRIYGTAKLRGAFSARVSDGVLIANAPDGGLMNEPGGLVIGSNQLFFNESSGAESGFYRAPLGLTSYVKEAVSAGAIDSPTISAGGVVVVFSTDGRITFRSPEGALMWSALIDGVQDFVASPTMDCARDSGVAAGSATGPLYVGTTGGSLYALVVDSPGLDSTAPWPKYQHDVRNTGNPTTPIQSCP